MDMPTCERGHTYHPLDGFCETCAEWEMELRGEAMLAVGGVVIDAPPAPNVQAREGRDRCYCGCKYWEGDTCIDCKTTIAQCLADPEWVVENRS